MGVQTKVHVFVQQLHQGFMELFLNILATQAAQIGPVCLNEVERKRQVPRCRDRFVTLVLEEADELFQEVLYYRHRLVSPMLVVHQRLEILGQGCVMFQLHFFVGALQDIPHDPIKAII